MACFSVGVFIHGITGNKLLKGSVLGFRNNALLTLLDDAVFLESLNLFLYTWRFFATLEKEEKRNNLKTFYRWLARVSIVIIPVSFYAIFASYVIEYSKYAEYLLNGKIK